MEHAELVAPGVAQDPEVEAALLLMVIAGRAQRLQASDLGLNIVGLQVKVHPFHDLRHSAATLALAAGANTRELMERMGHTSPTVALRYQHVMAGRDQAIAAALDELVPAAANLPPQRPPSRLVAR